MGITTFDETEIQITSVYFRGSKAGNQGLESYPRRMVYGDREYNFIGDAMRYLVQKGQEIIRLFDVNDGECSYRLKVDGANHWTLVGMKAVA